MIAALKKAGMNYDGNKRELWKRICASREKNREKEAEENEPEPRQNPPASLVPGFADRMKAKAAERRELQGLLHTDQPTSSFSDSLEGISPGKLREILRSKGLSLNGRPQALISRLRTARLEKNSEQERIEIFNEKDAEVIDISNEKAGSKAERRTGDGKTGPPGDKTEKGRIILAEAAIMSEREKERKRNSSKADETEGKKNEIRDNPSPEAVEMEMKPKENSGANPICELEKKEKLTISEKYLDRKCGENVDDKKYENVSDNMYIIYNNLNSDSYMLLYICIIKANPQNKSSDKANPQNKISDVSSHTDRSSRM